MASDLGLGSGQDRQFLHGLPSRQHQPAQVVGQPVEVDDPCLKARRAAGPVPIAIDCAQRVHIEDQRVELIFCAHAVGHVVGLAVCELDVCVIRRRQSGPVDKTAIDADDVVHAGIVGGDDLLHRAKPGLIQVIGVAAIELVDGFCLRQWAPAGLPVIANVTGVAVELHLAQHA